MAMYDTIYRDLSDEQLNAMCHSSEWSRLDKDLRLEVCQEMHNRYADEHGMERVAVTYDQMEGSLYGYYSPADGMIHLNESVLENGEITLKDGSTMEVEGSNAETLDTLFHESSHAYDDQLCEAVENKMAGESYNAEIIADAESRGIDIDLVRASNAVYENGDSGSLMSEKIYRVQDCEKRAYENGEGETAKVFESATAKLGNDSGYDAYRERLADSDNSYDKNLDTLKRATNDEDFDKTLNEQTMKLYYNEADSSTDSGNDLSRTSTRYIMEQTPGGQYAMACNNYGSSNERYEDFDAAQNSDSSTVSASAADTTTPSGNVSASSDAGNASASASVSGSSSADSVSGSSSAGGSSSHSFSASTSSAAEDANTL